MQVHCVTKLTNLALEGICNISPLDELCLECLNVLFEIDRLLKQVFPFVFHLFDLEEKIGTFFPALVRARLDCLELTDLFL